MRLSVILFQNVGSVCVQETIVYSTPAIETLIERKKGDSPNTRYPITPIQHTMEETVKSLPCIFSVSQSTLRRVLTKITAWVMVRVSYKSHSVSSFHSCSERGREGGDFETV